MVLSFPEASRPWKMTSRARRPSAQSRSWFSATSRTRSATKAAACSFSARPSQILKSFGHFPASVPPVQGAPSYQDPRGSAPGLPCQVACTNDKAASG